MCSLRISLSDTLSSLLRDIIAAGAEAFWTAQISANLLRDEELLDLIQASGGKWIFIGMESINPANLADVNKNFINNRGVIFRLIREALRGGLKTRRPVKELAPVVKSEPGNQEA